MSDFDSPWKEALDRYLQFFLMFFFPDVGTQIDWQRGYEVLDKELEKIVRDAEAGKRLADKLFKVWLIDGNELWILIHVEVQAQYDPDFPERMYIYNYRTYDRYRRPVVSVAILGDENTSWRPDKFEYEMLGCKVSLKFKMEKLLDYADKHEELESNANPFALVVLAHLQSQATKDNADNRYSAKVQLIKRLLERKMDADDIRQFFRFIDWFLELPEELEEKCDDEIAEFSKGTTMTYISGFERRAQERGHAQGRALGHALGHAQGLREGLELALNVKFGDQASELISDIQQIDDLARLTELKDAIRTTATADEFRQFLQQEQS